MDKWSNTEIIKSLDYEVQWHKLENIDIISSEGNMRRDAVDIWANLLREIIDSKKSGETLFLVLDLTGPKQATTPYSTQITRGIAQYVIENRDGDTYAAVLMKNDLLVGIIRAFFSQYFARQEKLIYRLFTDKIVGLEWLQRQVEKTKKSTNT